MLLFEIRAKAFESGAILNSYSLENSLLEDVYLILILDYEDSNIHIETYLSGYGIPDAFVAASGGNWYLGAGSARVSRRTFRGASFQDKRLGFRFLRTI